MYVLWIQNILNQWKTKATYRYKSHHPTKKTFLTHIENSKSLFIHNYINDRILIKLMYYSGYFIYFIKQWKMH